MSSSSLYCSTLQRMPTGGSRALVRKPEHGACIARRIALPRGRVLAWSGVGQQQGTSPLVGSSGGSAVQHPPVPAATTAAPQQQQQDEQIPQQVPGQVHSSEWYKSHYDMTLWHYLPWWLQPAPILVSGAIFFAAALFLDNEEPTAKTAVIAAGPVALYYVLALVVLPGQFQRFAVSWMKKHPEVEQSLSPTASQDERN